MHYKNASIAREVFPFVDWSLESNQLRITPLRSSTGIHPPYVLALETALYSRSTLRRGKIATYARSPSLGHGNQIAVNLLPVHVINTDDKDMRKIDNLVSVLFALPYLSAGMATAPSHPDVIWLCSDRGVFDVACDVAGVSLEFMPMRTTPSKTYNYYVRRLASRATKQVYKLSVSHPHSHSVGGTIGRASECVGILSLYLTDSRSCHQVVEVLQSDQVLRVHRSLQL